jgi:hypothetical protein
MKYLISFFILLSIIFCLSLFPIKCVVITNQNGTIIHLRVVKDGNLIFLSHINSIYNMKVDEVLRINKSSLELEDVRTKSYGIREYYMITEGFIKRSWNKIRFYNYDKAEFSLNIKDKRVDELEKFRNS